MNFFVSNEINVDEDLEVDGDQHHHFKNVFRGSEGDSVKLFNGEGVVSKGIVSKLGKKNLTIKITESKIQERIGTLNLILGVPKKEYLESIFKTATQIGIQNIYLVHTKFSPLKYKELPRYEKIFQSAVTQSENPYIPKIKVLKSLEDIGDLEGNVWVFTTELESIVPSDKCGKPMNIFIGPEGGFHLSELEELKGMKNTSFYHCPTPIMKAEVAVPFCAGMSLR